MQEKLEENIILYINKKLQEDLQNFDMFFIDIEAHFPQVNIFECYNYILRNSTNANFLNYIIRKINSTCNECNFSALIDFIITQNNNNNFQDLKVLAIKTIVKYKNPKALPSLMYCLNSSKSNYKIRLASIDALGKIGDKNSFEYLKNIVVDEQENSSYIKETAVVALSMLGDNRAIDVFDMIINTKQMLLDKYVFLKERIIEALGKFDNTKSNQALNILKKALNDNSSKIRISAIEALMNLNMEGNWDLIYDRLKNDTDIEVQKNALIALYNMSDRKILDKVLRGNYPDMLKKQAKEIIIECEDEDD